MHVRGVNPVVNPSPFHYLEHMASRWHNSKPSRNSLKFPAQVEDQIQASRERLNPARIKQHAPSHHWLYSCRFIQPRSTMKSRHHKGLEELLFPSRARFAAGACWGSQKGILWHEVNRINEVLGTWHRCLYNNNLFLNSNTNLTD